MTAARILERVQFGYAKAGQKLGLPHTLFRPSAPLTPALAPQNRMRTLPFVTSETASADFKRPSKYGEPTTYGLFDVRGAGDAAVRVGDYIDGPTGTYFVASLEQIVMPMMVQCNCVVTISREPGVSVANEDSYGGRTDATDGVLLQSWPASLLLGGRTQAGHADLPTDVQLKGYEGLLPVWPGLGLRTGDRVMTDAGLTLTLAAAELTDMGWRCDCVVSTT